MLFGAGDELKIINVNVVTAAALSSAREGTQRKRWEDEQNQGCRHQSKEGAGNQ